MQSGSNVFPMSTERHNHCFSRPKVLHCHLGRRSQSLPHVFAFASSLGDVLCLTAYHLLFVAGKDWVVDSMVTLHSYGHMMMALHLQGGQLWYPACSNRKHKQSAAIYCLDVAKSPNDHKP